MYYLFQGCVVCLLSSLCGRKGVFLLVLFRELLSRKQPWRVTEFQNYLLKVMKKAHCQGMFGDEVNMNKLVYFSWTLYLL